MNWYKFLTEYMPRDGAQSALKLSLILDKESHTLFGILKDLNLSRGFEQNKFHNEDLFTHLTHTYKIGLIYSQDPIFAIACLFHDIGKVSTRGFNRIKQDYTFHRHEYVGAKLFREFVSYRDNLWDVNKKERIAMAIQHHQYRIYDDTRDATIKKWLKSIGKTTWEDVRLLRVCDRMANEANKDKPIIYKKYIEVDNRVNKLAKQVF